MFSSILFGLWLLCLGVVASADDSCGCSVKYIVVEMPTQTVYAQAQTATSAYTKPTNLRSKPSQSTVHAASATHHNSTATFLPRTPAKIDRADPKNVVPKKNVSMSYGNVEKPLNQTFPASNTTTQKGAIDMDLVMNHPAVVLDYIDAIASVHCTAGSVTVQFGKSVAFDTAAKTWLSDQAFILITNNMGNCNSKIGQAFYLVDGVATNKEKRSITCYASGQDLADIAGMYAFKCSKQD
jgi:hypothetical protein